MDTATKNQIIGTDLLRYPRTPHIEGSKLQVGDEGHDQVPLSAHAGRFTVIEEKVDGANSGVSFSEAGQLLLQSRGHYLVGGGRERQFGLLKQWAACHEEWLLERLEDRYVMYGEWCLALHAQPYNALPHYFLEFDVWDKRVGRFLSTAARHRLLAGGPVVSVPVVYQGVMPTRVDQLRELIKPSLARTSTWREDFEKAAVREGLTVERAWGYADKSEFAEGLYGKVEEGDYVVDRFKFVRGDFIQAIEEAGVHHAERTLIPNQLAAGVDLYAPVAHVGWPQRQA